MTQRLMTKYDHLYLIVTGTCVVCKQDNVAVGPVVNKDGVHAYMCPDEEKQSCFEAWDKLEENQ